MFDLKAKLLEKGLVTKEQIQKIDQEKPKKNHGKENKNVAEVDFDEKERRKTLMQLKSSDKNQQYAIIRKWVDLNRCDRASDISLDCEKFFIPAKDGQITWLTLKKEVVEQIKNGVLMLQDSCMANHACQAQVPILWRINDQMNLKYFSI